MYQVKFLLYSVLAASIVVTAGCGARRGGVVIDPYGVDMAQYRWDLADCQEISKQVDGKAGGGAVGGAVVGGAVGGIIGDSSKSAAKGAGAGAVVGLARGARATRQERQKVVKNCLRNRGYAVLN